jgi:peptide deformylase
MAVHEILRMGHPFLLRVAEPVSELNSPWLHALVADMLETMVARKGAGLAAPQIGVNARVVVFELKNNPRYPDAEPVPLTVLVNPILSPVGAELEEDWEGCLSVPGMRGWVPRYKNLHYRGYDQFGAPIDRTVTGFHARVVQHECDHLDGILYPQRMRDLRKFGFIEELFPDKAAPVPEE